MWITLDQIECLQAVSEKESLNAASEALNKAKSAISYTISKLEEQLNFEVLDRSHYRIKLTPKGEAFLTKARPLLLQSDNLKKEVDKIASGIEAKIALSASAIFPSNRVNKVMKKLIEKFPSTEFIFHREILSGERMLSSDQVDIAIFENVTNTMDFDVKKIGLCNLKLVIDSRHPFLKLNKKQQTLDKLLCYPQIIQRSTIPDDSSVGIPKNSKKWTVSDIDSKKGLILEGLGWGRLPDHFIKHELKEKSLFHLKHINYDHSINMFICKKKDKPFGPVLQYIWDSF